MSNIQVVGNLTGDPELRYTKGGKANLVMTVVENTRRKNAQGQWEDGDPTYYDVVCWDEMATNASETLRKGDRVVVVGRMQQRFWEAKDGGGRRSKTELIAEEVAPSLRWATATVAKTERGNGKAKARSGGRPSQEYDDPDSEPF